MTRHATSFVAVLALSLPMPPVNAEAGSIALSICGDSTGAIEIPQNPVPQPANEHQCCGKACHAGCERKRKGLASQDGDSPET